jgi:SlyX protein
MHALDEAETRPRRRRAILGSNTPMPTEDDIDRRLTDLEVKASFAEDTLDALNETLLRQQRQIELLMREVAILKERAPEAGRGGAAPGDPRDDIPPHY